MTSLVLALALLAQPSDDRGGALGLPLTGGEFDPTLDSIVVDDDCPGAAGDVLCAERGGLVGGQMPSTTDPSGSMWRPGVCAPSDGTCAAANVNIYGGQDTTTCAIDGADPSTSCAGDNDTVTVIVCDRSNTCTTTVLTEGTHWTASASVATTCASLATAVDALAGVAATCTSPDVRITLEPTAGKVRLQESTPGCSTVATGTPGWVSFPMGTTGSFNIAEGQTFGTALTTQTPTLVGGNIGAALTTGPASTTTTRWVASHFQACAATTTGSGACAAQISTTEGFGYGTGLIALTAGSMTGSTFGYVRTSWYSMAWTNANVTALGAATSGNVAVVTLPAKTRVLRVLVVITGAAAGPTTLTVSVGRTSSAFEDYIVDSNAKAAANTVYGDADAEIGASLYSTGGDDHRIDDLTSWTGTTLVNAQFTSSGGNLDTVTGSTGNVYMLLEVLP